MNKFLNNPSDRPFHSSGIARMARGNAIGATMGGGISRAQRVQIERERRHIREYRESIVAQRNGQLHDPNAPKIDIVKPRRVRPTTSSNDQTRRQQFNSGAQMAPLPSKPQGFVEPPSRGYNPYA